MGKDVCQHLFDVKSHSSGCLKSVRTSHLHSISDLYLQARYGAEVQNMLVQLSNWSTERNFTRLLLLLLKLKQSLLPATKQAETALLQTINPYQWSS